MLSVIFSAAFSVYVETLPYKMLFHIYLTFNFYHNNFLFIHHDFQRDSSWIELDDSLLCVENHVLKLKFHFETKITIWQLLKNILDAVNSFVYIRNWLGKPCNF